VTSKDAGMAVPDWPTTYGYNMFFFPIAMWKGGIFYEHTHRLFASWVGLLTVVLCGWLWLKESRPWVRRLGWVALGLVILQGVLGGLRVVLFRDQIGIVHAALAQSFLCLVAAIALVTSNSWHGVRAAGFPVRIRNRMALAVGLIFVQLLLGATMRHAHAGLAIPDFPLAYGQLWPATDADTLQRINTAHADTTITAGQIHVHMAHRIGALLILVATLAITRHVLRSLGASSRYARGVVGWQVLVLAQALLGASTVWTGKAADIATLHVVVGAALLVATFLLTLVAGRLAAPVSEAAGASGLRVNAVPGRREALASA
jgi:cytochrome c oxidase assembly protein subunit 15